jgi:hypothetical protein
MEGILGRVIAVVLGLLALGGVSYASYSGFSSARASQIVTDIAQAETTARAGYSQGSSGYTNFTTANETALITAGKPTDFPTDMLRSGVIKDAWGNAVTAAPADSDTQGVITVGGGGSESADQCATVAVGLKDYVSLTVGTTTFTPTTQPDRSTAMTACSDTATIAVTFQ